MAGGRPTAMTPEVVTEICERLAGGESLSSICRDESLPARSTVLLAVVDDRDGFRTHYMRAREAAGFSHADTIVDLVSSVGDGEYDPKQAKVMMDGLKWAAERMAQKHHSARQEIDHTSGGEKLSQGLDTSKLSTAALKELMAARASAETDGQ